MVMVTGWRARGLASQASRVRRIRSIAVSVPSAFEGMGIFDPDVDLQDRHAGLGPLDIILAGWDFKMGLATIFHAEDLVQSAAQTQKSEKN